MSDLKYVIVDEIPPVSRTTKKRSYKKGVEKERYKTIAKQEYREKIWPLLLQEKKPNGRILFFSGPEGKEVETLRSLGVTDKEMVLIDESVGKVARAKTIQKCKEALAKSGKLSELGTYFNKKNIEIGIVNCDFCGNLSGEIVTQIRVFLKSHCLSATSRICVTYFKGRETSLFRELKYVLGVNSRAGVVKKTIENEGYLIKKEYEGEYKNGKSPMAWCIFELLDETKNKTPKIDIKSNSCPIIYILHCHTMDNTHYIKIKTSNKKIEDGNVFRNNIEKDKSNILAVFVLHAESYRKYIKILSQKFEFDGTCFHLSNEEKGLENFAQTTTICLGRVTNYIFYNWKKLTGCQYSGYLTPKFLGEHRNCNLKCSSKRELVEKFGHIKENLK